MNVRLRISSDIDGLKSAVAPTRGKKALCSSRLIAAAQVSSRHRRFPITVGVEKTRQFHVCQEDARRYGDRVGSGLSQDADAVLIYRVASIHN